MSLLKCFRNLIVNKLSIFNDAYTQYFIVVKPLPMSTVPSETMRSSILFSDLIDFVKMLNKDRSYEQDFTTSGTEII